MCNLMKKILIIFAFLIGFLADKAIACSCVGDGILEKEVKRSDGLLVGTIISKEIVVVVDSTWIKAFPEDTSDNSLAKRHIARYKLLVESVYKGNSKRDTVVICTGLGGGDCGVRFDIGKKYIVYGQKETYFGMVNNHFTFPKAEGLYWTNVCTRTSEYDEAEIREIEKLLKKKKRPKGCT